MTSPIRQALGAHLGQVLTPELAALIEQAAFFVPDEIVIGTPAREKYSDCASEAAILNALHWSESYGHAGYRLDHGGISDLEAEGGLAYYTLRSSSSILMGHAAFLLTYSHVNGAMVALDSFYYIRPEFRGAFGMSKLLRYAANDLRQKGITNIIVSHKASNSIGKIIERAGFCKTGETYTFSGE